LAGEGFDLGDLDGGELGGRPDLRRSASPVRPSSAYRPRQRRTVSTVTPWRWAIFAVECPYAASRTIRARMTCW
jgi:hypothetical protein